MQAAVADNRYRTVIPGGAPGAARLAWPLVASAAGACAPPMGRMSTRRNCLDSVCCILHQPVSSLQSKTFNTIGDITFKNNYTGFISMKLRSNKDGNQGDSKWLTCIKSTQLMPDVHCDISSQDYFTFTRDQMLVPPDQVTALRLVLQQPSTVWASFGVDNVTITEHNEEVVTVPPVVEWLEKHQHKLAHTPSSASKSLMPVDEIAAGLQRLWALTAKVQEQQTESALGRFDVDGSYEVNLLSYT